MYFFQRFVLKGLAVVNDKMFIITVRNEYVLPNINRTQATEITLAATEWSRLLLHDVVCSERVPFRRCREVSGVHNTFLSLVTWTFDL